MKLVRSKKKSFSEKAEIPTEKPEEQPRTKKASLPTAADFPSVSGDSWKILIVDDEPDVHTITKLSLKHFRFEDKGIAFLHAMSGEQARSILEAEPGIAAALVDVVMETEDAGLRLVSYIREELHNPFIRLIIRTGQPGSAPERYVIDHYDIDDYKDKTELIAQKLYTTIRSAIKSYRDISKIHRNRIGLEKILNASPELYRIQPMKHFFEGILCQVITCCNIGDNNLISSTDGFLAVSEEEKDVSFRAGTGRFAGPEGKTESEKIIHIFLSGEKGLPEKSILIPLKNLDRTIGLIYIEEGRIGGEEDRHLLNIMANQCAAAMVNLKLYNELEKSNRMNERKNHFLGMAAHDLRNPLGTVETALSMIREKPGPDDCYFLDIAKSAIKFSLRLVKDLLDVAKIESGKLELEPENTDMSLLVSEILRKNRFLAESKHIEIIFDSEKNLPEISVDPVKMEQVVVNLVSNAVKYSLPRTCVRIHLSKQDRQMILAVTDQGQGIPAHELKNLFQPFAKTSVESTADEESTGLGLMICKQIAQAHGGTVSAESRIGTGSTFSVCLPLPESVCLPLPEKQECGSGGMPPSVLPQMKILLVEDFIHTRVLQTAVLKSLGFTNITEAENGASAMELLKNDKDIGLIISDWNMPVINGYELLQWVRSHDVYHDIPFIMATAQAEKKEIAKAMEAGSSALISKPFSKEELKKVIHDIFTSEEDRKKGEVSEKPQTSALSSGKIRIRAGHIQITDHLILGVLHHLIQKGELRPAYFELETCCMTGWNPVQKSLEKGELDAALILAPMAMDLFSYGVPVRLILLAHKNGSICIKNKNVSAASSLYEVCKNKIFYIPHILSVHHMFAHMFFRETGLQPGFIGKGNPDLLFEVVPPVKMPEFMEKNTESCGFMVAQPIGAKTVREGTGELLFLSGEIWNRHPCCVVVMQEDIVNRYPDAVHELTDMLVQAGMYIQKNPDISAGIAADFLDPQKKLGINQQLLKNVLCETDGIETDDLYPLLEDLDKMQRYMNKEMGIGSIIDLEKFVDIRFADEACQKYEAERKKSVSRDMGSVIQRAENRMKV